MNKENIIAVRSKKVIYRDNDKVIKAFNEGYPKSDILNEAVNHARVEEIGINMPSILGVQTIEDKWSIVTEYIEGPTLHQLMEENPNKIDEYLEKLVEIQMEVHTKQAPLLNKLKDKLSRKIANAPIDDTTKYDLQTKLKVLPKHIKVCHGDFHPANIIVNRNGKWYILAWSHATQGNASADVAHTYIEFLGEGKEEIAKKYLNLYCEKSQTSLSYVQGWMSIIAAARLEKVVDEDKKNFLLTFVDVVEY